MSVSKISVDLRQRTFSIEVPDDRVEAILERVEALFKNEPTVDLPADSLRSAEYSPPMNGASVDAQKIEEQKGGTEGSGKKRGKGAGKARAWNLLEFPLTPEQRQEIRDFFKEKSPTSQNDTVAVVATKLKKFLNRSEFNGDEIHSALKIVNKPTPRNLLAVFGNIKVAGIGGYSDNKLVVNSLMEDHVAFHMKKKEKTSKDE